MYSIVMEHLYMYAILMEHQSWLVYVGFFSSIKLLCVQYSICSPWFEFSPNGLKTNSWFCDQGKLNLLFLLDLRLSNYLIEDRR